MSHSGGADCKVTKWQGTVRLGDAEYNVEMHGSSPVLWSSEREWRGNEIRRGEKEQRRPVR